MEDKTKQKSEIMEIRDILKNEFQRFASINTVLKETSDGFNHIDNTYSNYGSQMDEAKNHLIKMKRREFFENMFIYIGMIIYFCCVAYVMLKRFPIHRIVLVIYNILEIISTWIFSSGGYIIENLMTNKNVTNLITNTTTNIIENIATNITDLIKNNTKIDL